MASAMTTEPITATARARTARPGIPPGRSSNASVAGGVGLAVLTGAVPPEFPLGVGAALGGAALGDGDALGLGLGDALGDGDALGLGLGDALGLGLGLGVGVGVGVGVAAAATTVNWPTCWVVSCVARFALVASEWIVQK